MENRDIAKALKILDQLEIDGYFLIEHAKDKIHDEALRNELMSINAECKANIAQLGALIRELGEEPPAYKMDFKGKVMQAYTSLRGMLSDKGVMESLDTNIKPMAKAYEAALRLTLPYKIRTMLKEMYSVVLKHVNYISLQAQSL